MRKNRITACFIILAVFAALLVPSGYAGATDIRQQTTPVSGSFSHTLAIRDDDTVWAFGSNSDNQLGLGSGVTQAIQPARIDGFSAVSVAAGNSFSVALQHTGLVYVWGNGDVDYPRLVHGINDVVAIEAGESDVLALREDGTVWQWTAGETPARVPGLGSIAAIAAGGAHFHALTYSGEVWSWGSNTFGQLGIGSMVNQRTPVRIEGLVGIVSVTAGFQHSLAISENGRVFSWGENRHGELGDGSTGNSSSPVELRQPTNVVQVSAGNAVSMALTSNNRLFTWGYGEFGQLAHGNNRNSVDTPTEVNVPTGQPIFIGSGMFHSFYVNEAGDLYVWGRNDRGQLGTNRNTNENAPRRVLRDIVEAEEFSTDMFGGASDWAVSELSLLYDMGMVPSLLWSDYRSNITRAELAHLLVTLHERILGVRVEPGRTSTFGDTYDHLLELSIRKANHLDIINGITPTQFSPDDNATREQAAKMIAVFVERTQQTDMEFNDFRPLTQYRDANLIGTWAIPFVAYAYDNGIMQGANGYFNPLGMLTREQALVMMYRTMIQFGWGR